MSCIWTKIKRENTEHLLTKGKIVFFLYPGTTELPSMSDDTCLDEDMDGSEVDSRSTTESSSGTSAFISDFESSSQSGDGHTELAKSPDVC